MRNATSLLILLSAAGLSACGPKSAEMDNNVTADEIANAPVDIDTLPPDESTGTSSDELANGVDGEAVGPADNGF